jgi:hypothetical protein
MGRHVYHRKAPPARYWAIKETEKMAADGSFWSRLVGKKPDPQLIAILREELTEVSARDQLEKLDKLEANINRKMYDKEAAAPPANGKKAEELDAASRNISKLSGKSESDQAAYLSETFDQATSRPGVVSKGGLEPVAAEPANFVFKDLSPAQAAELSGRLVTADAKGNLTGPMADELRGTKAGDEILVFYRDPNYAKDGANRLNFVFTKQAANQFGEWDLASKKLAFNSELVNTWMKNNKVTLKQLFDGDPSKNTSLQKLSQYLAPTFVHEATHQRQDAKAAAAGYDYQVRSNGRQAPYQMELETEAFSMASSLMAEHLQKRGASYADNLGRFDKKNAELFLEKGVEGIRLANHRNYAHLESLEGSAAKEFAAVSFKAYRLSVLETEYKTAPGTMTQEKLKQLRDIRADMDVRFKWYASVHADSAAAEAKINGWREEVNSKLYPSKITGVKPPPELL